MRSRCSYGTSFCKHCGPLLSKCLPRQYVAQAYARIQCIRTGKPYKMVCAALDAPFGQACLCIPFILIFVMMDAKREDSHVASLTLFPNIRHIHSPCVVTWLAFLASCMKDNKALWLGQRLYGLSLLLGVRICAESEMDPTASKVHLSPSCREH